MSDSLFNDGYLGPVTGGGGGTPDAPGSPAENVTNAEGTSLAVGEIVRISGDLAVLRSQADSLGHLQGTVGVAGAVIPSGQPGIIYTSGRVTLLMAAGLVGVGAGQTVFVSAATAGRGTNVEPAISLPVAVIKDASNYGIDGTVVADLNISTGVITGGTFPGFGGAGTTVSAAAGTSGVSATASRSDQTHQVLTSVTAPTSLDIGDSGTAGTSNALARSDHEHPFPASVTAPPDVGPTGAVGTATTPARSDHTHGGGPASWTVGSVRWYALDFTGGNDANAGFSDVSMAEAGAVAKKTWAGLIAILPSLGSGRDVVIAIKNRDASGTSYGEDLTLLGISGYRNLHVVGTSDFSNNTTDKVKSGAVIGSAGPNGDSSWTCAAGATSSVFTISAGALPAEPGISGMRVRFTGNVTPGMANVTGVVWFNDGTNITVGLPLAAVPASGDTFFLELPGVNFTNVLAYGAAIDNVVQSASGNEGMAWRGIGATALWVTGATGKTRFTFCKSVGSPTFRDLAVGRWDTSYRDIDGTTTTLGMSFRSQSGWLVQRCIEFTWASVVVTAGATSFSVCNFGLACGKGSRFFGQMILSGCYMQASSASAQIGSNTTLASTTRNLRITGSNLLLSAGNGYLNINGVIIDNAGALDCIDMTTARDVPISINNLSGSTGNTATGLSVSGGNGNRVDVGTAVTVTGLVGDIKLVGGALASWTGIVNLTNVVDQNQNEILSSAGVGHQVDQCRLVTNKTGATVNIGHVVRSNGTSAQVTKAQADSQADATGVLGVMVTDTANNAVGYYVRNGFPVVRCAAAPTPGALLYLSTATAGLGTSTIPTASGTNQKLRLGYPDTALSVSAVDYARGPLQSELVPIDADGAL